MSHPPCCGISRLRTQSVLNDILISFSFPPFPRAIMSALNTSRWTKRVVKGNLRIYNFITAIKRSLWERESSWGNQKSFHHRCWTWSEVEVAKKSSRKTFKWVCCCVVVFRVLEGKLSQQFLLWNTFVCFLAVAENEIYIFFPSSFTFSLFFSCGSRIVRKWMQLQFVLLLFKRLLEQEKLKFMVSFSRKFLEAFAGKTFSFRRLSLA